jgi:hypothetical protein
LVCHQEVAVHNASGAAGRKPLSSRADNSASSVGEGSAPRPSSAASARRLASQPHGCAPNVSLHSSSAARISGTRGVHVRSHPRSRRSTWLQAVAHGSAAISHIAASSRTSSLKRASTVAGGARKATASLRAMGTASGSSGCRKASSGCKAPARAAAKTASRACSAVRPSGGRSSSATASSTRAGRSAASASSGSSTSQRGGTSLASAPRISAQPSGSA